MPLIETMIEEIFTKQFRYRKGRHTLESALMSPERMQWIGSKHCAILFHRMNEKFGSGYYVEDYCGGKVYGHYFCPAVGQFTSISKLIVPMLALIVKRFGWGPIIPVATDYKKDMYTFSFMDSPIARETYKLYGKQKGPVDSMVSGLLAGSMEHILQRKLASIETGCLASGAESCTFTVSTPQKLKELVLPKLRGQHLEFARAILEAEARNDFLAEAEKLRRGQDKKALMLEAQYLGGGE